MAHSIATLPVYLPRGFAGFPDSLAWLRLANSPCNRVTLGEGLAEKPHDIRGGRTERASQHGDRKFQITSYNITYI